MATHAPNADCIFELLPCLWAHACCMCPPFGHIQNPAIQELASVAHPALGMQHMLAVHVGQ